MRLLKAMLTLLVLIFIVQGTQAATYSRLELNCLEQLTKQSPSYDSASFYLDQDEVDRNFGNDHLAFAIYSIRTLLARIGCSSSVIKFGHAPHGRTHSRCTKIIANEERSRVCYVETNLGYFFVTKDYLDTINLTFARWD